MNQTPAAAADATAGSDLVIFDARRALSGLRAWARARAAALLCAALLAVMSVQMLAVIWQKSITADEIVMIPAAYYHLAAGNCQLINEHPPLSKLLAGVPLLFLQPEETAPEKFGQTPDSALGKWIMEEQFWEANPRLFESLSFWARVPMILLTALTGVLLFAFVRELFGDAAAALAVALYSLEPTLVAHGRVVQTDVPATFGYLLVVYALLRYLRAPSLGRALLLGGAGGVACLAKFSMLLVAPALGVVFLALWWRAVRGGATYTPAAHACAVALAALLVVNAAYFFDHRAMTRDEKGWVAAGVPAHPKVALAATKAATLILPTDFVVGALWQLRHNREGHNAGLLGQYSRTGWWYYFPVAFALKTTVPFLLLSLAALAWCARGLLGRRDRRLAYVLVPFALYTAFVLMSRIDIGVRYYLPAYTFLCAAGGALLVRLWQARRGGRAGALAAAALLGWMCVEAARAYPDHMTYMNQLASRAPHWWYLSDSNVEWGDDVREMAEYLRARGETQVRMMALAAFITTRHYGVAYLDALAVPKGPPPRYTAVGASFLNGSTVREHTRGGRPATDEERVNTFDEYRRRTPEKIFGGSIYLFREDGP